VTYLPSFWLVVPGSLGLHRATRMLSDRKAGIEGLVRTGIDQRLGDWLVAHAGADATRLVVLLMIIVAAIGSAMRSTGVVAIFIPIVLRIARQAGTAPGRLMMPLSIAALIRGMLTLVATPPNLVVQAVLVREGHAGFGFFAFSSFGLPVPALAIGYMLLARRWLAPGSNPEWAPDRVRPRWPQRIDEYELAAREHRFHVREGSPLAGPTLEHLAVLTGVDAAALALWIIAALLPLRSAGGVIEAAAFAADAMTVQSISGM